MHCLVEAMEFVWHFQDLIFVMQKLINCNVVSVCVFPQTKSGTPIIFSPLNQPISTEHNIPISSDSVFQVRQILCQSKIKKFNLWLLQCIVVYEQNVASFWKFTAALGCIYFNVFKHEVFNLWAVTATTGRWKLKMLCTSGFTHLWPLLPPDTVCRCVFPQRFHVD